MRFSDSDECRCSEDLAPGVLVRCLQGPERFRGWEFQGVEFVETDSRSMIIGESQHAEKYVDREIGSSAAFIFDPLLMTWWNTTAGIGPEFKLILISRHHLKYD